MLAGLCVLGFFLGQVQNVFRDDAGQDFLTLSVQSVVNPGADVVTSALTGLDGFWTGFRDASRISAENERLRQIERAANQYQETLDRLQSDLDDLRTMLDLPVPSDNEKLFARVTGYFQRWNRLTLNVGARDGVKRYMPVVSADGLIGIIEVVESRHSQVLLISSPVLKIGAKTLGDPNVPGLLHGETTDRLVMEVFGSDEVHTGETVVTSGFSEDIPAGIHIGTVVESRDQPRYGKRRILVEPSAKIGNINEVFVIK